MPIPNAGRDARRVVAISQRRLLPDHFVQKRNADPFWDPRHFYHWRVQGVREVRPDVSARRQFRKYRLAHRRERHDNEQRDFELLRRYKRVEHQGHRSILTYSTNFLRMD
jgi:hypothetical protein